MFHRDFFNALEWLTKALVFCAIGFPILVYILILGLKWLGFLLISWKVILLAPVVLLIAAFCLIGIFSTFSN